MSDEKDLEALGAMEELTTQPKIEVKIAEPPSRKPEPKKPDTITRTEKGTFVKGISPNPGGRPKMADQLRDYAQSRSMEAMKLVYEFMKDDTAKTGERIAAARLIMQVAGAMVNVSKVEVSKDDPLKELSNEELMALLKPASESKN